jgi:hypothetical protein
MPAQKTIEINREIIIDILQKTLSLPISGEIFIPCSSKKEQKDTHTCVVRELKTLSEIDPTDAASISHRTIFKDHKFWVVLTHINPALSSVFTKIDGVVSKIDMT